MANERKEPTLSSTRLNDSVKKPTSRAEQRATANPQKPVARAKTARPAPKQVVVNKSNNGLVLFVLLLSLLALAGAAYSIWQLLEANKTITSQQTRIVELEQKLTLTGDASSQSITSLAANFVALNDDVKLTLTEIDKLWATRNVNKKAIADNAENLGKIQTQAKTLRTDLANSDKKITSLETASTKLDESTKSISDDISAVSTKTQAQGETLASLAKQIKAVETRSGELDTLTKRLKTQTSQQEITLQSLRERVSANASSASSSQINQLSAQMRENQEAIKAIDAFRITVNRELLLLKQRAPAAQ